MVQIISRSEWGARAPRAVSRTSWSARQGFTVHHSAGPATQTVRQIQDFHMDGRGWSDVGYNLLVDDDGNAYDGRGWLVVGAHAAPYNTSHIGVCYIGQNNPTAAAKRTIRALYDEACKQAGRKLSTGGHRDLNETNCPGDDLYAWVHDGMPTSGLSTSGGDDVIGLRRGDKGEAVKGLQALIKAAGQDLPKYGVDGDYGKETADALVRVRQSVGSNAVEAWGDHCSGHAYAQLIMAVARNQD